MKKNFKKLKKIYLYIPELIFFILKSLKQIKLRTDFKFIERKPQKIHIVGNGPSNYETLKNFHSNNEEIMCVNFFALTSLFNEVKPNYYVLLDPKFFDNPDERHLKLVKKLNEVTWSISLFVAARNEIKILRYLTNENIKIKVFKDIYLSGENKIIYYLYRKNLAVPKFQNVIVSCIYTSINLGYNKIYLHGVETNEFSKFIISEKNEAILITEHFYGKNTRNLYKEGLIKKGEFGKYLEFYANMLLGYAQIERYSKDIGSQIYNCTKNSYIDSFEKI